MHRSDRNYKEVIHSENRDLAQPVKVFKNGVAERLNPGVRGVTMNRKGDTELLEAYAKQKDEAAFAQLLETYAGMVYATAKRRTSSVEAAHEITQTAFARLATKAERLIGHTSIGAWLHRTTVLESKKYLHGRNRCCGCHGSNWIPVEGNPRSEIPATGTDRSLATP